MSDPRYIPRDFLVAPHDFGRSATPRWHPVQDDWTFERRAQLDASISQHLISVGVRSSYLQKPRTTKITDLAAKMEVEYNRLQKMLSGLIIMQMVDLARLRLVVGTQLDPWMMRGEAAEYVRAMEREFYRKKERRAWERGGAQQQATS